MQRPRAADRQHPFRGPVAPVELSASLRVSDEPEAWSRCAEAELEALDPNQPVFRERRRQLHADLARTYELELAQPDDALRHQSALVRSLSESGETAEIESFPELPEASVLSAKLGLVKVEIAENKFGEAEAALGRIKARNTRAKDANTTAGIAVLRARIVIKSNAVDRFEEVRRELEKVAEDLKGVDDANRAAVYAALGDILFKQGKSDEARFPYMRVVCMYPSESGQVANCLLNAGQCFINLATAQKETDKAKYKQYLDEGMKLLRECAGKYKNPGARKAYRRYKAEWEALKVPDTKGG